MGKRKIVWSHRANIKLFQILDFYTQRNQSPLYAKRIFKKIKQELSLLKKQPELGIPTDLDAVRGLIVENFIIYYEEIDDMIVVHFIRDCNQNPADLIIK